MSSRRMLWGSSSTIMVIAAAQGCTALAFAVLTHRSSLAEFGVFIGVHGAAMAIGSVADFGGSGLRLRSVASGAEYTDLVPWLLIRMLWHVVIAAALIAIALPLTHSMLSPATVVLLCGQVITMNLAMGATADVRALKSPLLAEGFVLIGNSLILVAAFAAPDSTALEFAAAAAAISWIITAVLALAVLPREARRFIRPHPRMNPWRGSLHFGLGSLAVAIGGFAVPAVALVAGSSEAAQLGAVSRWYQPITLLAAGTSAFLTPRFAAATSHAEAVHMLRSIRLHLVVGAIAALGLFLLAPFLVNELLADGYGKSVVLLRLYALAAVPVLLGQPLMALLNTRGHDRFIGRLFLAASVAGIAATAAFAAVVGAAAAPTAAMVVSGFLTVRAALYTRRLVQRDRAVPDIGRA